MTAFGKDTAALTDNEAAAVAFPGSSGLGVGGFGASFPTIAQTALQSELLEQRPVCEREPELLLRVPVPEHRGGTHTFDGLPLKLNDSGRPGQKIKMPHSFLFACINEF